MKLTQYQSLTLITVITLNSESLYCTDIMDFQKIPDFRWETTETDFKDRRFNEEMLFAYENQIVETQEAYTDEDFKPADKELNLTQKAELYNRNIVKQLTEWPDTRDAGDNVLKYMIAYNQQLRKIIDIYKYDKRSASEMAKEIQRIGKPTYLNVTVNQKELSIKLGWHTIDLLVLTYMKNQTVNFWDTCMSYIS